MTSSGLSHSGAVAPQAQVLERTAAAEIADDRVELAVGPEGDDAAIVVGPRAAGRRSVPVPSSFWLGGTGPPSFWNDRSVVRLWSKVRLDAVPLEAIDPVAEQRSHQGIGGIGAKGWLRAEQVSSLGVKGSIGGAVAAHDQKR